MRSGIESRPAQSPQAAAPSAAPSGTAGLSTDAKALEVKATDHLVLTWAGVVSKGPEVGTDALRIASEKSFCLLFVLRGRFHADLDGAAVEVPAGSALLVRPRETCIQRPAGGPGLVCHWAYFENKHSPGKPGAHLLSVPRRAAIRRPDQFSELLRTLTEEFHEYRHRCGDAVYLHRPESHFLLLSLLARLSADLQPEPQHQDNRVAIVERARDYIRRTARRHPPITSSEVARGMECSRGYLSRAFREILGHGVTEEIQQVRFYSARDLLARTRLSIAAVSEQCGFSRPHYFSALFTRRHGMSPTEYRTANSHLYQTPGIA